MASYKTLLNIHGLPFYYVCFILIHAIRMNKVRGDCIRRSFALRSRAQRRLDHSVFEHSYNISQPSPLEDTVRANAACMHPFFLSILQQFVFRNKETKFFLF